MRRELIAVLLVICTGIVLLTSGAAGAAEGNTRSEYKQTISTAREAIWKAITSGQGSGATVAVMDRGEIVYSEGIGVADRARNRPVDRNTRFNIGSTSKMFAAVAVLLLVDEGKVSLDESVVKYITEFKMKDERYKKITVRMLFNHSSGLPGTSSYTGYKPDPRMHRILLDTLKDGRLKHDPGAMSIYCNDGFTLAEIIVENVSGKKYLDFLAERVFAPLGMKNTSASVGEISEANIAEHYDTKTGKKYPREAASIYAAGGLSSTAEDMCRFGDSFSSGGKRILSDASIKEILSPQPTRFSDKLRGPQMLGQFGWEYSSLASYREKGIQVLGKGGNTESYSANLQIVPGERIVIALCISGHASGESLTRPILDALMKDKKLVKEKARTVKKPADPRPIPGDMLKYAGYYVNEEMPVKVSFDRKKKTMTISSVAKDRSDGVNSKLPISLIYNDGYFHNNEMDLHCYFTTVDGEAYIVIHGSTPYEVEVLLFQKLKTIKEPKQLKENMQKKVWLMRNAPAYLEVSAQDPGLVTASSVYKELPGYVDIGGMKKIEGADRAGIAATAFRDQAELLLFIKDGRTWSKMANYLFSTDDGIEKVKEGTMSVKIGSGNCNEWLKVEKDVLLNFEKPKDGRVIVLTPEEVLFDSIVDSDETCAPEGSYVFFAGSAGDIFRVYVK
ncbi:MAG TPA: serine hydrolase domain-containing protein [Syntrophorhabdaceae bacterium]|nr:serine hydrolase domain-containing protein [Syntrophorhabdaceae bacterium]